MAQECDLVFAATAAQAIAGNTTDFMTTYSTLKGSRVITLSVALTAGVKLYARLNGVNCVMNADTALTADALYTFSFIVSGNTTINFRASGACAITYMVVTSGLE